MSNPVFYESSTTTFGTSDFLLAFTVGATGAVPTTNAGYTVFPQFIKSVVRSGVGVYTITLNQPVLLLTQWNISNIQAAFSTSGACDGYITADNSNSTTPTIQVSYFNKAATATEAAVGDSLRIYIGFRWKK